ncbi:hypothetical protein [Antarctobacter jejuensis]|uniref:hypothetical protein n=1 Tax=Antarctobacter jejuensis TaxID=1439938 RepID=UPI003FD4BBB2
MLIRPRHPLVPEAYDRRPYLGRLVKGARQELKFALRARHPVPKNKFMIFAQGRTGSTLLTSTLDRHPDIRCDDEILIVPRAFPRRFVETAARQAPAKAYGFHVKISQLHAWQRIHDIADFLREMEEGGWKIIYLWRENILRQVVSNVFAEAAGTYHMDGGQTRPTSVVLPLDRLALEMNWRTNLHVAEQAAVRGRNVFEIVYERDLLEPARQAETFAALQQVIGVSGVPLEPRLKKMVVAPLSELLSNYDEVAEWIAARPDYARFLET